MKIKSPFLVRLLRQQFIYIALAAVVGGIVWANRLNINPIAVIVYTLTIANLMTIPLESLRFLYWEEPFPRNWVIYMGLMLVLMVPVYVIATVLVYWVAPPEPQSLMHFIQTGWRLPILITIVYGTVVFLYDTTKDRLERRNVELLKTVRAKKLDPARLITHRFKFGDIIAAYETFGSAADNKALKVIIAA